MNDWRGFSLRLSNIENRLKLRFWKRFSDRLLTLWLGLTTGIFLAEGLGSHDWGHAAEVSYFQGFALFMVWLTERSYRRHAAEAAIPNGSSAEGGIADKQPEPASRP